MPILGPSTDVDARRPEDAYSFPWDAPLVPAFPLRFRDVTILTAFYRTDTEAIERILPPPLVSTGDVVAVHIYMMGDVDHIGAVNECNVMVGARLETPQRAVDGGFTTAQFITSDVGLAHGREIHGQPKKLARIDLQARDDLYVARVERNGIDIITATLGYKQRQVQPEALSQHFDFTQNINYKVLAHIDGQPAIRELTARQLRDVATRECWTGPCTVELRHNAQAPVWRLPVLEPLDGFLWSTEFTLIAGERIYDYLAEEPT